MGARSLAWLETKLVLPWCELIFFCVRLRNITFTSTLYDAVNGQYHGPDGVENMRLLTSTYDLTMSHAEGPRRVDTMLWSGITKVHFVHPRLLLSPSAPT